MAARKKITKKIVEEKSVGRKSIQTEAGGVFDFKAEGWGKRGKEHNNGSKKITEIEKMRKLLDIMERHIRNELTSQDIMDLKENIKNWDENVIKISNMFSVLPAIDFKSNLAVQDDFVRLERNEYNDDDNDDEYYEGEMTEEEEKQVSAFVKNMMECVDDYLEEINNYESEEELYQSLEKLSYPEQNDYGSYSYEYSSKAKVKVACKEEIRSLVDFITEAYEWEKEQIISCTVDFYSELKDSLYKFIDEFSESYDEYMSLECEGDVEEYLLSKKAENFRKDILCEKAKEYDLTAELNLLVKERFGNRIEKLIDMKKYFSLCEYDEEDGYYCYIMENACDAIYKDVYEFLTNEMDAFPKSVYKAYRETIIAYCEMLKRKLEEL